MNKLSLACFYAFCGLLLAICISLIISMNVWLEMRIHERLVIGVCVGLGILFSLFKRKTSPALFFVLQSLMFLLCFWFSKMDLIYYIIRNFYLSGISIFTIKIVFLSILTFFNGIVFFQIFVKKAKL
ncbi:hypothetical protein [Sulfurospirillum arcachonense]|uniref:hypothetical protein n=1 Tax=Sulfurospirillum arcachonense TaxID=57666 RepID=UPI000469D410|nr:hypothetical protein [Sulfurospirillum arcachonense]